MPQPQQLCSTQSHSTVTAAVSITDNTATSLDNKFCFTFFIDLHKAFDTVDQNQNQKNLYCPLQKKAVEIRLWRVHRKDHS